MTLKIRTRREAFIPRIIVSVLLAVVLYGLIAFGVGCYRIKRDFDLVGAASNGNAAKVATLLSQGANPEATHLEGSSALWWAVSSGSLRTVQVLLEHGASPNSRGQYDSVLDAALANISRAETSEQRQTAKAILKALVAHGVDTSSVKNDVETVKLLRDAGAKL